MPTCSEYSIEALKTFGFFKGLFISIKRILSCHPIKFLGGGEGFDPVNKKIKIKKIMDTKNVIAAISLSAAVIVLYSLFFPPEPVQKSQNLSEKKKLKKILIHQV